MRKVLSIEGRWGFAMGDGKPEAFLQGITLPGSLAENGFGDPLTVGTEWTAQIVDRSWYHDLSYAEYRKDSNVKVPFFAHASLHYVGAAWFRREIEIPENWQGQRVELFLERAHVSTTVWWDGVEVGTCDSLGTPHVYNLGAGISPGPHELLICVDNRLRIPVGINAHSVSDHTQSNWNGIVGRMELRASSPIWIEDVQVFPNIERRDARVTVRIGNATGDAGRGHLEVDGIASRIEWAANGGEVQTTIQCPADAAPWNEFSPELQEVTVRLESDHGKDERVVKYGLREIRRHGRHILLNGTRIFLRGTLECAVFPLTGYPAMDRPGWEKIFRTCRDYGFNHVRFHSWCPPEAAFEVADELGFYLQVECSAWCRVGEGGVQDEWFYREAEAMLKAYGNHPSFALFAYGNEPQGNIHRYLPEWVAFFQQRDSRRLYTTAAGWPVNAGSDYDNTPAPRLHAWAERLDSPVDALPPTTNTDYRIYVNNTPRPLIAHETGEWCAFPDFRSIDRYTGVLRPGNLEIARDFLRSRGLEGLAGKFLRDSGRLQVLLYREEIERALRTPDFAGFQVLQINDFPGQGTAMVGWLDAFWESKGYTSPEEFRRFNGPVVLLARFERYVWVSGEKLRVDLEMANFGPGPMENAVIEWQWRSSEGSVIASGCEDRPNVPIGNVQSFGMIELPTDGVLQAERRQLILNLRGTDVGNSWDLWIYPLENSLGDPDSVLAPFGWIVAGTELYRGEGTRPGVPRVVTTWEELASATQERGRILFQMPPLEGGERVETGFSPIFWNTAWTRKQPPHTLGISCDPAHPIFQEFPNEGHTDWHWWDVLCGATGFRLDRIPFHLEPIVRWIDDWNSCRSLGLIFEAKVDGADVLFCGADLVTRVAYRPSARQFRRSLLRYLQSADFSPVAKITFRDLTRS